MKKVVIILLVGLITFSAFAASSRYISSKEIKNIKGNAGVRAVSMGGAFVAVANDSSAIYWNPAGLSKLKRAELNGQITGVVPLEKTGKTPGDMLGKSELAFSWGAFATSLGDMSLGFSADKLLDVNSSWTRPDNGSVYSGFSNIIYNSSNAKSFDKWQETYNQSISVYALGLSKKFNKLSLGIVGNIWNGTVKTAWDINTGNIDILDANSDRGIAGYSADMGILMSDGPFSIGAVWKGFLTSIEQRGTYSERWYPNGVGGTATSNSSSLANQYWHNSAVEKLTIGVAFEPGILTLAADIDYENGQFGSYRFGSEIDLSIIKARAGISTRKVFYDNYKTGLTTEEMLNDYSLGAGVSLLGYVDVDAAVVFEGYKTVDDISASFINATNISYIASGTIRL